MKSTEKKFKGHDCVILGDSNAKLGPNESDDSAGSHVRGRRNENGDFLHEFMLNQGYIASNTFFKHKASHITTFEMKQNDTRIFNQIDWSKATEENP